MRFNVRNILIGVCLLLSSCSQEYLSPFPDSAHSTARREEMDGIGYKKVMIVYCEAYNNLTSDIQKNISQLTEGYLPAKNGDEALVIYEHSARYNIDWTTPTEPVIYQMYTHYGQVVRDTIKRYSADEISVSTKMVKDVLTTIKRTFPSSSYGLIYNSHASGWMPTGYEYGSGDATPTVSPSWIGAQYNGSSSNSYSLNTAELAEAIPMHLDYIVFDCCLMGGVETTYEFRDKVDLIAASPTEVLSYGFNYYTMAERLLKSETPDVKGVCEDFYEKLASSSYLTVGLYDCSKMDTLARACRKIFDAHPDAVLSVSPYRVQSYNYTFRYHYDFRDIIEKMGASADELKEIDDILSELVLYKAATDTFIGTPINPDTFSGISMYLPNQNWPTLNGLYKDTLWNQATHLLQP